MGIPTSPRPPRPPPPLKPTIPSILFGLYRQMSPPNITTKVKSTHRQRQLNQPPRTLNIRMSTKKATKQEEKKKKTKPSPYEGLVILAAVKKRWLSTHPPRRLAPSINYRNKNVNLRDHKGRGGNDQGAGGYTSRAGTVNCACKSVTRVDSGEVKGS